MTEALQITVTAPVTSFRDRLYDGVQAGLPCPPPSTAGGFLASAAGGWMRTPPGTRFAMAFTARGSGTDLETYHPLDARGTPGSPTPRERPFLADVTLTIWLVCDLDLWEAAMRRPVWPMRFGRSQDLAAARTLRLPLGTGKGLQGQAIVPDSMSNAGTLLQLPVTISENRSRSRWGKFRYAATGSTHEISADYVTADGQAIALLPPVHPDALAAVAP